MTRGRFLSLDGIDGCGKSTQCRLLVDWLRVRGLPVTACREPGGTELGDELRVMLLHSNHPRGQRAEALLFMASRAQLVQEVIQPALDRGEVVVCDRFLLSTVVYQGHGGGLDPRQLWEVGHMATAGVEPDLTLVLDLPEDLALSRLDHPADRVERRGPDFFRRVRQGFLDEAALRPDRIHVIDAAPPAEAVWERVRQEVMRVLEANPGA